MSYRVLITQYDTGFVVNEDIVGDNETHAVNSLDDAIVKLREMFEARAIMDGKVHDEPLVPGSLTKELGDD